MDSRYFLTGYLDRQYWLNEADLTAELVRMFKAAGLTIPPTIVTSPPKPPVIVADPGPFVPAPYHETTYVRAQYDVDPASMAILKARGINLFIGDTLDWNGGFGSGPAYLAAAKANGVQIAVAPGVRYPSSGGPSPLRIVDDTSNLIQLLDEPIVKWLVLQDEPGGAANVTADMLTAQIEKWAALAAAAVPPRAMKPVMLNEGGFPLLYKQSADNLKYRNVAGISANFFDAYYVNLFGRGDWGADTTLPVNAAIAREYLTGIFPGSDVVQGTKGKFVGTFVDGGQVPGAVPTPAQINPQLWSNFIMGGDGISVFDVAFLPDKQVDDYMATDGSLIPTFKRFYDAIDQLQVEGYVMRTEGGRAPNTPRVGAAGAHGLDGEGGGGVDQGPQMVGGVYRAPTTGQLQGGFFGTELRLVDGSKPKYIVCNQTGDTLTLTDDAWGFKAVAFAPGAVASLVPGAAVVWLS